MTVGDSNDTVQVEMTYAQLSRLIDVLDDLPGLVLAEEVAYPLPPTTTGSRPSGLSRPTRGLY